MYYNYKSSIFYIDGPPRLILYSSQEYSSWGILKFNWDVWIRVSFETSFDSKQPKLEPKLVSALSKTTRLFRLFRSYTETASFGVSMEPKQTEVQPKQTENSQHFF